jgi:L-fuculose-phosphate aldolase
MKSNKELLCELGNRIWQQGLSPGTGGNISTRVAPDKFIISPTLTSMGFIEPNDLCTMDTNGRILGCKSKPSSEYKLHLYVYKMKPEINAVIHAHPPFASAFSVRGEKMNTFIQPETVVFLGEVPVVEYGTPSTDELPHTLDQFLDGPRTTFLLRNHGVLCIGDDLMRTYYNLETVENLAKVLVISRLLGGEKEIGRDKLRELIKLFNVDLEL